MKTNMNFLSYLAQFFLEWEIFRKRFVEKFKTHILFSVTPPLPPKIVPFMRQYGKKIVQLDNPQMTIWCMRIACCIPNATNTPNEDV
jgi:hypothetical protein